MNAKTKFSPWGIALVSAFLLTACSRIGIGPGANPVPIPAEPLTLEVWRLWDDSDILDQNIAEYQEKHPNVNIVVKKIEIAPNETIYDYQSRLIKLIADNKGPDIFEMHNDWLGYQINQLAPMPEALMNADTYRTVYPKAVVEDFTKDNKIYAVPLYIDNLILFYNPEILSEARIQKPPATWQELLNMTPTLTKFEGGRVVQSAIALGATDTHIPRFADILATLMVQNGAQMTDANRSQATFDLPLPNDPSILPGAEALEFYTSFSNPRAANYTYTGATDRNGNPLMPIDVQAFKDGQAAMMIGYAYQINNLQKTNPRFFFETAPLPQVNLQDPKVLANYWGMAVSRGSKYPDVAWDFINFLQDPAQARRYLHNARRVSARMDLKEDYNSDLLYGAVATQLEYSFSWYRNNTPKVEEIFSTMVKAVTENNIDATTAVRSAVQNINALGGS